MHEPELKAWRAQLRRELLADRAAMPRDEHSAASERIAAAVDALLAAQDAKLVGAYLPIRNEPDPMPWILRLLARGGTVALPVVEQPGAPLAFHRWSPGEPLTPCVFSTSRPAVAEPVRPEVLVIPVLGFDDQGYRLGYGGGFYDRTLAALSPLPFTIGTAFARGRIPTLHAQAWDVPLDRIVTD